jgi:predicted RNA-binding protein with PIN domain
MPYVIDGNNVMARRFGPTRDLPAARKRLIDDLVKLVAARRVKVKVVFDGFPGEDFPEGRRFKGVQVLYARPGSDADSRINDLVKKSTHRRDMIVVSSDTAVSSFAASHGARVMNSSQFSSLLDESRRRIEAENRSHVGNVDVQDWLEFFNTPRHKDP